MQLQPIKHIVKHITECIYPPRCIACSCLLSAHGQSSCLCEDSNILLKYLCRECAEKLSANKIFNRFAMQELNDGNLMACDKCGEILPPLNVQFECCPICRIAPFAANHIRSLYTYNNDTRAPLMTFKYFQKFGLNKLFSGLIMQNLKQSAMHDYQIFPKTDWDYIIPIPSSPDILRARGYNHIYLTAKIIAKNFGCKTAPGFLVSGKNRTAQTMLTLKERPQNVKNAFVLSKGSEDKLRGSKILLLDDMLTTGSTIDAATKVLLDDGHALSVDVLTVFRSASFARDRIKAIQDLVTPTGIEPVFTA